MTGQASALAQFLSGLHVAFWIAAGMSIVAAVASALQPSHSPKAAATQNAPAVVQEDARV